MYKKPTVFAQFQHMPLTSPSSSMTSHEYIAIQKPSKSWTVFSVQDPGRTSTPFSGSQVDPLRTPNEKSMRGKRTMAAKEHDMSCQCHHPLSLVSMCMKTLDAIMS